MNKLVKMVGVAMCGMTMFGIVGCGASPEKEYSSLLKKGVEVGAISESGAKNELEKFKTMTPEQQKHAIEEAKFWVSGN